MIVPGSILYVSSLWAIKFSLVSCPLFLRSETGAEEVLMPKKVIFYKRLAARTTTQLVYTATMVFLVVTWIGLSLFAVFECWPISRKWTEDPARKSESAVLSWNYLY